MDAPKPIYTIGYEGRTVEEVAALMSEHQISLLIDVRRHPYSRGRSTEWNRNRLFGSISGQYESRPEFGNEKTSRWVWMPSGGQWWSSLLLTAERIRDKSMIVCILCKEHHHQVCHRRVVAALLAAMTGGVVVHL